MAVLVVWSLRVNEGHLIYPLDDTYIGLAIAEEIARGTYGANLGEWSGPASTILWPPVLAFFVRLPFAEWMPLILNGLLGVGSIVLVWELTTRLFAEAAAGVQIALAVACAVVATALLNLVGLTMIGMEHGLQVFLALAVGVGLVDLVRGEERHPWLLTGALVLGPLTRYEALALTIPALVLIWVVGQRTRALRVAVVTFGALGLFSLFLMVIGVGPLPGSVVAKRPSSFSDGGVWSLLDNLRRQVRAPQGLRLVLFGLAVGLAGLPSGRTREEHALALWALCVLLLQLLFGGIDYLNRYEIYAWGGLFPVALYMAAPAVRTGLRQIGPLPTVAALLVVGQVLAWPYVRELSVIPAASNDIYTQQYQMHRFLTEYHRGPVAVNDLGWTSYRNDEYVLDLMGLASPEVLSARATRVADPSWLTEVIDKHDVDLVMIFDVRMWFPALPATWIPIARLEQLRPRATEMAWPVVTFFATTPRAAEALRPQIEAFSGSLPPGVRLIVPDPPRGGLP